MSRGSREERRESENFHVGLKVPVGGTLFPLGSSEPPPLILHVHPLRLTPGLAPFGGWGSLCFLCFLWTWGEPAATALEAELFPWRWGP